MADLPQDIPSLLVPMYGRPWLVPNIIVAEIIPLRQPDRPAQGAEWLLGFLNWRDEIIPMISFERLNESGQVNIGPDARIAVINNVSGKVKFYAVVIQGIPRATRVSSADLVEEPTDSGPAESMNVQLGGDLAVIPDLDAIERALEDIKAA
jgi:chemosensory pili system protein ChpC